MGLSKKSGKGLATILCGLVLVATGACQREKVDVVQALYALNNIRQADFPEFYNGKYRVDNPSIYSLVDSVSIKPVVNGGKPYYMYSGKARVYLADNRVEEVFFILTSAGKKHFRYCFYTRDGKPVLYKVNIIEGDTIYSYKDFTPNVKYEPDSFLTFINTVKINFDSWTRNTYTFDGRNIVIAALLPLHGGAYTEVLQYERVDTKMTLLNVLSIIDANGL